MIEVEFIGGPQDGLIQALPDLRNHYLFPAAEAHAFTFADHFPQDVLPTPECLIYEVELDPVMRRPSINDQGRYRYRYTGIRSL